MACSTAGEKGGMNELVKKKHEVEGLFRQPCSPFWAAQR